MAVDRSAWTDIAEARRGTMFSPPERDLETIVVEIAPAGISNAVPPRVGGARPLSPVDIRVDRHRQVEAYG
jgi:hypothetical protein